MHVCVSRGPNGVWGSVLRRPEWFWIEWSLHLCCSHTWPPPLFSLMHTHANAHTKFCSTRAALCFQSFYCLMTPNRLHTHGVISVSHLYTPSCLPHPTVSYIVLLQWQHICSCAVQCEESQIEGKPTCFHLCHSHCGVPLRFLPLSLPRIETKSSHVPSSKGITTGVKDDN